MHRKWSRKNGQNNRVVVKKKRTFLRIKGCRDRKNKKQMMKKRKREREEDEKE